MAIVPGVMGPTRIVDDRREDRSTAGVGLLIDIRFDREQWRYVCYELQARKRGADSVTTEALREVKVTTWIQAALTRPIEDQPVIYDKPNPGSFEPWGRRAPAEVGQGGPTERALRWVAHFYRLGYATSFNPTREVEEALSLPRSTADRWVSQARRNGYLGAAEGASTPTAD